MSATGVGGLEKKGHCCEMTAGKFQGKLKKEGKKFTEP